MFDASPPARRNGPRHAGRLTRTIRPGELAATVGDGHRQLTPDPAQDAPLMAGHFNLARLREGLYLHCTDIEHLRDMQTRFATREHGLKIMLKLEGNAEVSFGGLPLGLDAGFGRQARPCGAVLALHAPEDFERRARAGTRERMVVLTLAPAWLEASGLDSERSRPHLSLLRWHPSARAIALAEQLIRPDALSGDLLGLQQESRALELIGEALAQTGLLCLVILGGGAEFRQGFRMELDPHRAMACLTSANAVSAGTVWTSPRRASSTRRFASRIQS